MYDSNTSQQNIYSSIDDLKNNQNRNNNENSQNTSLTNGPSRNSYGNTPENHYARVQKIERPKSVPPNMFNQIIQQQQQQREAGDSPQDYPYSQPSNPTPLCLPLGGRPAEYYGNLHKPHSPVDKSLPVGNSASVQSPPGRQLPGPMRSQTPNIRIGPTPKTTTHRQHQAHA